MSSAVMEKTRVLKGGEFIIKDSSSNDTFIPEEFNEEAIMVQDMVDDFVNNVIQPLRDKIEKQEDGIAVKLMEQAAELGLLGAHMPEAYGGMEMDTNTITMICEHMGPCGAWNVSYAVQTGIGMLPLLYFGTDDQKNKYLTKLITGELKAAYCLTEPTSGSDALSAKSTAVLSQDGSHFVLNGQKMWISNAGFADVFVVFAQMSGAEYDDKQQGFTAFIVEKTMKGLTLGAEEDKLGIKGSSTRQVFFESVKVPKENLLGEPGKGHLIAFNVLNVGRFKLGAMCLGGAKKASSASIQYANERHQFKKPIASFGAIKFKLAEQAIRIFAAESALYRASDLMRDAKEECRHDGDDFATATLKSAEEYSIECAILKVLGSEVLDYVVDENVQIHGGLGFSEEYTASRAYRDSRINRIYEGTNEINRMLMIKMMLKKAMNGELNFTDHAWAVQKELASMPSFNTPEGVYGQEKLAISNFKKVFLMTAGAAVKAQMDGKINLRDYQEIVMNIADMMIDLFTAESLLLRVDKLQTMDTPHNQEVYDAILKVFITDAESRIHKNAKDALSAFAEDDLLRILSLGLKRFTKYPTVNVLKQRRIVSDMLCEANEYCL